MEPVRAKLLARRAYYGRSFGGSRYSAFLEATVTLLERFTPDKNLLAACYLQDALEDDALTRAVLLERIDHFVAILAVQLSRPVNRVGFDYAAYYRNLDWYPLLPLVRLCNLTLRAEIAKRADLTLVLARIRTENTTVQTLHPDERIYEECKYRINKAVAL